MVASVEEDVEVGIALGEVRSRYEDADEELCDKPHSASSLLEVMRALRAKSPGASVDGSDVSQTDSDRSQGERGEKPKLCAEKVDEDAPEPRQSQQSEKPRVAALRRSKAFNKSSSRGALSLLDSCPPDERVDDREIVAVAAFSADGNLEYLGSDEEAGESALKLERTNAFTLGSDDQHAEGLNGTDKPGAAGLGHGSKPGAPSRARLPLFGKRIPKKPKKVNSKRSRDSADSHGSRHLLDALVSPRGAAKIRSFGNIGKKGLKNLKKSGSGFSGLSNASSRDDESVDSSIDTASSSIIDEGATSSSFSHLKATMAAVRRGQVRLPELLEVMLALTERLPDSLSKRLYKLLSNSSRVKELIKLLVSDQAPKDFLAGTYQDCRISNRYSYVIYNAISRGSPRLRKAVLASEKCCNLLFTFMEQSAVQDPDAEAGLPEQKLKLFHVMRILSSLLRESPEELTKALVGRKGLLEILVEKHLSTPGLYEFLVELFCGEALAETAAGELMYGAPNPGGIVHMAKKSLFELLSGLFVRPVAVAARGYRRARLEREVCAAILTEVSCRALAVPAFDSSNCSYGRAQLRELNRSLERLSLLADPGPLRKMLDFGIGSLGRGFDPDGHSLRLAVGAAAHLLAVVERARGSKRLFLKKLVGERDTTALEQAVIANLPQLLTILQVSSPAHSASGGGGARRAPRGQLKLAVVSLLQHLFSSRNPQTHSALLNANSAPALLSLLRQHPASSLLHQRVVRCFQNALANPAGDSLRAAWLRGPAADLPSAVLSCARQPASAGRAALLQMGALLALFLDGGGAAAAAAATGGLFRSAEGARAFRAAAGDPAGPLAPLARPSSLGGPRPADGRAGRLLAPGQATAFAIDGLCAAPQVRTDGSGVYDT